MIKKKLQILWFIGQCFIRAVIHGTASCISLNPRRIGVVQLAKLGDMVCTTPVFRAIKERYPEAQLITIGNAINRDLLHGHPHIDEYAVWGSTNLRALKLDVVCLTIPNTEAFATAYLAGIPAIICPRIGGGSSIYETSSYKLLSLLAITVPHHLHHYIPREYLRLLEPIGIYSEDTTKTLAVSPLAEERAETFIKKLGATRVIGMTPSAGNKIKEWPVERFAKVAETLVREPGTAVVVLGTATDSKVDEMFNHLTPTSRIINAKGMFNLEELKSVVKRLNLMIAVDTGPIYIAEAFGVATVDIVGPVDEKEQPPMPPRHIVVVPERTKPAVCIMNARIYNEAEVRRQIESISVEQVLEAVVTTYI